MRYAGDLVQRGQETDFILVSCSGAGVSSESKEKVLRAKQVNSAFRNAVVDIQQILSFCFEVKTLMTTSRLVRLN